MTLAKELESLAVDIAREAGELARVRRTEGVAIAATKSALADIVIADTTALMVAIYSAMLFKDGTLYRFAVERQRSYDHTLVTGLDLPWVADGVQRDGPHVRAPVDTLVRGILDESGIAYRVVYGQGPERLAAALAALGWGEAPAGRLERVWRCEKCSDPECEHRLFTALLAQRGG